MMKKNMGLSDRIIRIAIALILGGLYFGGIISGGLAFAALALAAVFLLTSFVSFCPLYLPFGIKTCKTNKV